MKERKVSIWVKLFVLFHLLAITTFALPRPSEKELQHKVSPAGTDWINYWNNEYLLNFPPFNVYTRVTGFWQYWDMFSPNPAHTDRYGDAVIVYRDGSTKLYEYPRMAKLSVWDKFLKERYRKYFERAGNDDFAVVWPTFCLRIALLNDNPKNPPVRVVLYRHWREVLPPGRVQPKEYTREKYYTYIVDQDELAHLRKLPL